MENNTTDIYLQYPESKVCRDTALQDGRSRFRLPMASLEHFISIIVQASLFLSTQPLTDISARGISWGYRRPVNNADNLTTFMCHLPQNLVASSSWIPQGLYKDWCNFTWNWIRKKKNPNHTSLNENYVVPCICLRAIWHMHDSMWRATRMTRDLKRIIVAHCLIALWRHYYYALAKFYCRGRVEGHFSGYPSHKTYTCQK